MLLVLTCVVQIIATTAVKPRQVNLALETVFNFDKNNADLKLINSIQDFISKLKHAVANSPSRRNNYDQPLKFTEFLKKLIKILQNYNDNDLENIVVVLDDEIRKYHYKGCKFHELLQGDMRRYITDTLEDIKEKPAKDIRKMLDEALNVINNAKYDTSQSEIFEYINTLYGKEDAARMIKVLDKFKHYNSYKRNNVDMVTLVRGGLRSILFDHFSKLNTNTRTDFKIKLDTFSQDVTSRNKGQHLNIEYRTKFNSDVSKENNEINNDRARENSDDSDEKNEKTHDNHETTHEDHENKHYYGEKNVDDSDINHDNDEKSHDDDKKHKTRKNKHKKLKEKSKELVESFDTTKSKENSQERDIPLSNKKYFKDSIEVMKDKKLKKTTRVFISVEKQEKTPFVHNTRKRPKFTFITLYPEDIKINTKKRRFNIKSSTKEDYSKEELETEKPISRKRQKFVRKRLSQRVQTIWPEELPQNIKSNSGELLITQNIAIDVEQDKPTSPGYNPGYIKRRVDSIESSESSGSSRSKDIFKSEEDSKVDKESYTDATRAQLRLHFSSRNRRNQSHDVDEGLRLASSENARRKSFNFNNRRLIDVELNDEIPFKNSTKKALNYKKPVYEKLPYWEGTTKESNTTKINTTTTKENLLSTRKTANFVRNRFKIVNDKKKDITGRIVSTNDGNFKKFTTSSRNGKINVATINVKPNANSKTIKIDDTLNKIDTAANEIDTRTLNDIRPANDNTVEMNDLAKFNKQNLVTPVVNDSKIEDHEFNRVLDTWKKNLDNFYDIPTTDFVNQTTRKAMYVVLGPNIKQNEKDFKERLKLKLSKLQGNTERINSEDKMKFKSQQLREKKATAKSTTQAVTARKMTNSNGIENIRKIGKNNLELTRVHSKTYSGTSPKTSAVKVSMVTSKTSQSTPKTTEIKNKVTKDAPERPEGVQNIKALSSGKTVILENTSKTTQNPIKQTNITKSDRELENELHALLSNYGVTLPRTDINANEFVRTANNHDRERVIKNKLQSDLAKIFQDVPSGRRAERVEAETDFPDPFMDLKDVP